MAKSEQPLQYANDIPKNSMDALKSILMAMSMMYGNDQTIRDIGNEILEGAEKDGKRSAKENP